MYRRCSVIINIIIFFTIIPIFGQELKRTDILILPAFEEVISKREFPLIYSKEAKGNLSSETRLGLIPIIIRHETKDKFIEFLEKYKHVYYRKYSSKNVDDLFDWFRALNDEEFFKIREVAKKMEDRKEKSLKEVIDKIRFKIRLYKQLGNKYPDELDDLVPGYLSKIPEESKTKSNEVFSLETTDEACDCDESLMEITGEGGWIYNPKDGKVKLNLKGKDEAGILYTEY